METRKNRMEGENKTWFGARKACETNDRKGINEIESLNQTLGRYARGVHSRTYQWVKRRP